MIENNPANVSSAFEMLLEEVEAEIDFINGIGSKAFEGRNYEKAQEALEQSRSLVAFRDRAADLRNEWEKTFAVAEQDDDQETRTQRQNLGKLRKGLRTPESAYYKPIMQVLDEMGGSGRVAEVLDRVGDKMKPVLKDVDFGPLTSNPENPRWRNAAQWARNSMVKEGILKNDSPHGVWEISDKGRAMLKNYQTIKGGN